MKIDHGGGLGAGVGCLPFGNPALFLPLFHLLKRWKWKEEWKSKPLPIQKWKMEEIGRMEETPGDQSGTRVSEDSTSSNSLVEGLNAPRFGASGPVGRFQSRFDVGSACRARSGYAYRRGRANLNSARFNLGDSAARGHAAKPSRIPRPAALGCHFRYQTPPLPP